MSYRTIVRQDGTVSYWDVYRQQRTRRMAAVVAQDARVMASLSEEERQRIERAAGDRREA